MIRTKLPLAFGAAVLLATTLLVAASVTGAPRAQLGEGVIPPEYQALIPDFLKDRVPLYGTGCMLAFAESFGLEIIMGKEVGVPDESSGSGPPAANSANNVGVGVDPVKHENEPTVVVNPRNKRRLVAGSHSFPDPDRNRCVAYRSTDGGKTWSSPFKMPHLSSASSCSDPVLAYSPDGRRVYYAYMDIKQVFSPGPPATFTIDLDIVVSFSDDDGATWTGPVTALDGAATIINFTTGQIIGGFQYDKPWIGTHVAQGDDDGDDGDDDDGNGINNNMVYVSTTRFDDSAPFACHISFTTSSNKGTAWSSPTLLDSSGGGCGNPTVVQGSRPTGGPGSDVLVAWYHSGNDGWLSGGFKIRTRRSSNRGGSFGAAVDAAVDSFEAPFWLGPFAFYHRWWGTMFPDVEIDSSGRAHIIYTHDPVANLSQSFSGTPEDGDVRYVSSRRPYASWSSPQTVNDDGLVRAQGYAALETSSGDDDGGTVHVLWEDHRRTPNLPIIGFPTNQSPNLFFDMFYATKGGGDDGDDDDDGDGDDGDVKGFSANRRVTDVASINDWIFIGDYNDITTLGSFVYGIWTDRRHQFSILAFEDNVFGARIKKKDDDDDDEG